MAAVPVASKTRIKKRNFLKRYIRQEMCVSVSFRRFVSKYFYFMVKYLASNAGI
jgi:hypothetical protein